MPDATFAIPNFLGGEISQFAQGRFDKPDYRTSLNVCFNAFPVEIGAWARRPGTRFVGTTRGGAPGRVVKFDFQQSNAVTLEFTDGHLRFRGSQTPISPDLVTTNDGFTIADISTANPAVVLAPRLHLWATGNTVKIIYGTAPLLPLLRNREFVITVLSPTTFSLADAITGAPINGATLVPAAGGAFIARVHELTTPYVGGSWADVRAVQAQTTDILLEHSIAPQALTVRVLPALSVNPQFVLAPAIFNDGPYLDPFINGVQATPNQKSGIVTLALSFPAYSATKAYAAGNFVSDGGINYRSLSDQNVGNAPAGSPGAWVATSVSAAINDGRGFLGSDTGRLVRLFSEPAAWAVGSAYAASTAAAPVIVSYNPTGLADATAYYQALVASTGKVPGTDLTNWQVIPKGAAIWTWGRITALSNIVNPSPPGSLNLGDATAGGGLSAAFDGNFSKAAAISAKKTISSSTSALTVSLTSYVGKNYAGASNQIIQQATIYPSNDSGFAAGSNAAVTGIILTLRGSASLPLSSSDGVFLGQSGLINNTFTAVNIISLDQVTAWKYAWVEQTTVANIVPGGGPPGPVDYTLTNSIGQLSLFNPPGTGTGTGVNVEILGPPLLYTVPIVTWRLGVYSDTTGWPTCGTYDDGRLYLGGAIANRFDASMSNGIDGATVNFAPTDQYGAVAANNALSYTLNAKDANQIVWMAPEEGGLVMGTQAGEWLVRAPTTGPIAPNNISARRITKVGAANIEPCRTEHTNIFVHRFRRKLTEYFPDAYSGKFTGPNLADKAGHIISSGIAEIAYTSSVTPVIWGRCDDGSLFGVTYKRDTLTTSQPPTYAGWHRHALGTGRIIESICSGPSTGGDLDTLTMVTNDSSGIRHVELLTDTPDENVRFDNSWYLDDAVAVPTGARSSSHTPAAGAPYGGITLNGLWHLNGKTVQVFAAGLDCGDRGYGTSGYTDFVVSNGSVFVPYGDGVNAGPGRGLFTSDFVAEGTLFVAGCTYNSDGQLVRPIAPADSGARNGPALGKTSRIHQYAILLSNSRGISIGATFDKMYPVPLNQLNGNPIATLAVFSGVVRDGFECDYSTESMISWRISRPFSVNVVAISGFIQTQDA